MEKFIVILQNFFLNLLHPFQPFILGQRMIGPLMANKFGVKLVMYGENQAEYGNKKEENKSPKMNENFFASDFKRFKFGGISVSEIIKNKNFKYKDFKPYMPLIQLKLKRKR